MQEQLPSHGIHLVQNSADHVGVATVVQQDGTFGEFTVSALGLGMQI
jgi:hypothetical protein